MIKKYFEWVKYRVRIHYRFMGKTKMNNSYYGEIMAFYLDIIWSVNW